MLVCLDDVQWADSATAAALRALPSRLATVPIGWLIAFRPGQGSLQVRGALTFLEGQGAAKIALGPWTRPGSVDAAQIRLTVEQVLQLGAAI